MGTDLLNFNNQVPLLNVRISNSVKYRSDWEELLSFVPFSFIDIDSLEETPFEEGDTFILSKEEGKRLNYLKKKSPLSFFMTTDYLNDEDDSLDLFQITPGEREEVLNLFGVLNQFLKEKEVLTYWESTNELLKKIKREVTEGILLIESSNKASVDSKFLEKFQNDSQKIQLKFWEITNEEELGIEIKKLFSDFDYDLGFELIGENSFKKQFDLYKSDTSFLIKSKDKRLVFSFTEELSDDFSFRYLVSFCVLQIESFLKRKVFFEQETDSILHWEEALNKLPFATILLSEVGEVLAHNSEFSNIDILPINCLKLKLNEKLEISGKTYLIKKSEWEMDENQVHLFVFQSEGDFCEKKDGVKQISNQELGIMTSSIAHELNNPLAGILAALSVLSMEEWEEDERQSLEDMKVGANRCKDLVEVFLGFSKATPEGLPGGKIIESFNRAKELIRYRIVESGIQFDLEIQEVESFSRSTNPSICSMIFYLILSDLMTAFSHHRLIVDEENSESIIKGKLIESAEKIEFSLVDKIQFSSNFKSSKLLNFLVSLERFSIEFEDGRIILSQWKLT